MEQNQSLCTRHAERLSAMEANIAEGSRQFGEIHLKLDKIAALLTGNGEPGGLCETVRGHDVIVRQAADILDTVKCHERIIKRTAKMVGVMACSIAAAAAKWIWDIFTM